MARATRVGADGQTVQGSGSNGNDTQDPRNDPLFQQLKKKYPNAEDNQILALVARINKKKEQAQESLRNIERRASETPQDTTAARSPSSATAGAQGSGSPGLDENTARGIAHDPNAVPVPGLPPTADPISGPQLLAFLSNLNSFLVNAETGEPLTFDQLLQLFGMSPSTPTSPTPKARAVPLGQPAGTTPRGTTFTRPGSTPLPSVPSPSGGPPLPGPGAPVPGFANATGRGTGDPAPVPSPPAGNDGSGSSSSESNSGAADKPAPSSPPAFARGTGRGDGDTKTEPEKKETSKETEQNSGNNPVEDSGDGGTVEEPDNKKTGDSKKTDGTKKTDDAKETGTTDDGAHGTTSAGTGGTRGSGDYVPLGFNMKTTEIGLILWLIRNMGENTRRRNRILRISGRVALAFHRLKQDQLKRELAEEKAKAAAKLTKATTTAIQQAKAQIDKFMLGGDVAQADAQGDQVEGLMGAQSPDALDLPDEDRAAFTDKARELRLAADDLDSQAKDPAPGADPAFLRETAQEYNKLATAYDALASGDPDAITQASAQHGVYPDTEADSTSDEDAPAAASGNDGSDSSEGVAASADSGDADAPTEGASDSEPGLSTEDADEIVGIANDALDEQDGAGDGGDAEESPTADALSPEAVQEIRDLTSDPNLIDTPDEINRLVTVLSSSRQTDASSRSRASKAVLGRFPGGKPVELTNKRVEAALQHAREGSPGQGGPSIVALQDRRFLMDDEIEQLPEAVREDHDMLRKQQREQAGYLGMVGVRYAEAAHLEGLAARTENPEAKAALLERADLLRADADREKQALFNNEWLAFPEDFEKLSRKWGALAERMNAMNDERGERAALESQRVALEALRARGPDENALLAKDAAAKAAYDEIDGDADPEAKAKAKQDLEDIRAAMPDSLRQAFLAKPGEGSTPGEGSDSTDTSTPASGGEDATTADGEPADAEPERAPESIDELRRSNKAMDTLYTEPPEEQTPLEQILETSANIATGLMMSVGEQLAESIPQAMGAATKAAADKGAGRAKAQRAEAQARLNQELSKTRGMVRRLVATLQAGKAS